MIVPEIGQAYWIGMQTFTVGIGIDADGSASMVIGSMLPDGKQQSLRSKHDPMQILSSLIENWPAIAGKHGGNIDGRHDIGRTLSGANDGELVFVWESGDLMLEGASRKPTHLGSESVIPVEILATFGDFIAGIAPDDLRDAWKQARSATDLPPFDIQDSDGNDVGASDIEIATWYATKLGIQPDVFVNGAIMLHAQHVLWATNRDGEEATAERQDPCSWAPVSPDAAMAAAAIAAQRLDQSVEEFVSDAVASAWSDARSVVIYGHKKGDGASIAPSP